MSRLAFSFLIVAFALGWRAHKLREAGDVSWRPSAMNGVAACCAVLGVIGTRLRHARR